MKILHLFSNWKWTGPAEHALNLVLHQQRSGHSVVFACAAPPPGIEESIIAVARPAGIEPYTGFRLAKHLNITADIKDITALGAYIKTNRFDIVHCHLPNDHLIAGLAIRLSFSRTALVRTCYDGEKVKSGLRGRFLFGFATDALLVISEAARNYILRKRCISAQKLWKIDIPVDLHRFNPDRVEPAREAFGLPAEAVVGGIVARVQKHRRFNVILEALQIVLREFPNLKFMIIGRGTHIQEIAIKPSQTMGIRPNLIFTGYKKEDFRETLACLNFKVFLVPGSDGSCRAVREAMAMGIPVIAADRGMLPEIVEHEKEGLIIDDMPENLAQAMLYMIEHPDVRRAMGHNARAKASRIFNIDYQGSRIESVYEKVLIRKHTSRWRTLLASSSQRNRMAREARQKAEISHSPDVEHRQMEDILKERSRRKP